jgi:hypothetical protein
VVAVAEEEEVQVLVAQAVLVAVAQVAQIHLIMALAEHPTLEVEAEVLFSTVLPIQQVMVVLVLLLFATKFKEIINGTLRKSTRRISH